MACFGHSSKMYPNLENQKKPMKAVLAKQMAKLFEISTITMNSPKTRNAVCFKFLEQNV